MMGQRISTWQLPGWGMRHVCMSGCCLLVQAKRRIRSALDDERTSAQLNEPGEIDRTGFQLRVSTCSYSLS